VLAVEGGLGFRFSAVYARTARGRVFPPTRPASLSHYSRSTSQPSTSRTLTMKRVARDAHRSRFARAAACSLREQQGPSAAHPCPPRHGISLRFQSEPRGSTPLLGIKQFTTLPRSRRLTAAPRIGTWPRVGQIQPKVLHSPSVARRGFLIPSVAINARTAVGLRGMATMWPRQ